MKRLLMCGLVLAAGCSDALEQDTTAGQVVAVADSASGTLSLVSASNFTASRFDLGNPVGGPWAIAGRNSLLAVSLAGEEAVFFVDFASPAVNGRVALPGAGVAGVAIQDDSIAWVANPQAATVTRINYLTGSVTVIAVGPTPMAVAITHATLYVVNANLTGPTPAGPGSISWAELTALAAGPPVLATIPLTGTNAQFAVVGADSLLYVVERGTPGAGDGRLSIVDPVLNQERVIINGLGELPGPPVFHPSGRLLIASEREGILELNTLTRELVRGVGEGRKPDGHGVAALGLDQRGRIYALDRGDCNAPGVVHVLSAPPNYGALEEVTVDVCPTAAAPVLRP